MGVQSLSTLPTLCHPRLSREEPFENRVLIEE